MGRADKISPKNSLNVLGKGQGSLEQPQWIKILILNQEGALPGPALLSLRQTGITPHHPGSANRETPGMVLIMTVMRREKNRDDDDKAIITVIIIITPLISLRCR